MRRIKANILLVLATFFTLASCRSSGEIGNEPEALVDKARVTFQSMMSDSQYPGLLDLATRARGIIIVPNLMRAAFFVGGRGGNGVMLVRGEDGRWSPPAFYTIGGLSFGLQLGGQSSELIIVVMTQRGVDAIMSREVTLGGDAGLAVGELGQGVNAATAIGLKSDMYAFSRSQGLFAGVSLEGSVISPRELWNQQMYGHGATPKSILVERMSTSSSNSVNSLISAMP
ncbi:MAG: lipid-binding SYLF domain-containing protein [Alphaproteobacteria bacterium]|nr:lipid-binding SYLF domain-containing protein [Alphaproteobacteria bacterium]